MKRNYLFGVVLVCAVVSSVILLINKGCEYFPESTFTLAKDSRMPRWFLLPRGIERNDVELSMSYLTVISGPDVVFTLREKGGHVIQKLYAKQCSRWFPSGTSRSTYPIYVPVVADGSVEMIEHKKMEPIFYVTEDPSVAQREKVSSCGGSY